MLELLQFYVSGFWTWLGLTVGLYVATGGVAMALIYITKLLRLKWSGLTGCRANWPIKSLRSFANAIARSAGF